MFDKLKFWKKEDPLNDLPETLGGFEQDSTNPLSPGYNSSEPFEENPINNPPEMLTESQNLSMNSRDTPVVSNLSNSLQHTAILPHNTPIQSQPQDISVKLELVSKDLEIVSTKIDTLKASIENLNQRLKNIEGKW